MTVPTGIGLKFIQTPVKPPQRLVIQSNPAIWNSVNSKSPLFRRKVELPWIYPYVFSHLLSAISKSVISNSRLFRTRRSFPIP